MSSPKLLKTDVPNLLKDPSSGAIINIDRSGLEAARAKKRAAGRLDSLELEVASITVSIQQQANKVDKILELLQSQSGNRE